MSFFKTLAQYDSDVIKEQITKLQNLSKEEYIKNLERIDEKYLGDWDMWIKNIKLPLNLFCI